MSFVSKSYIDFGGEVRGADLYSPVFYLRVLQNGMMANMIIQKGFVSVVDLFGFVARKSFSVLVLLFSNGSI